MEPITTALFIRSLLRFYVKANLSSNEEAILLLSLGLDTNTKQQLEQFNEIRQKLDSIKVSIERIEETLNTSIINPLMTGYLNFEDAKKVPIGISKTTLITQALSDFNKIISLPQDKLEKIDIRIAKSFAYFGKASALHALNASEDDIAENILKGFLEHNSTAKYFMSEDIWNSLLTKTFNDKAIVTLNIITNKTLKNDTVYDSGTRFTSHISLKITNDENDELVWEKSFEIFSENKKQITIPLDAGEYSIKAKFKLSFTYNQARQIRGYSSEFDRQPRIEKTIEFQAGSEYIFDIIAYKEKVNNASFIEFLFTACPGEKPFLDFKKLNEQPIDVKSEKFKKHIGVNLF